MSLIRKIIDVGKTSRGVIIPKSWLQYYENKNGKRIVSVAVEVNEALIIRPILQEKTTT